MTTRAVALSRTETIALDLVEHANALELSEFEVFCRAYVHWYGADVDAGVVERDFGRYLMGANQLPCYVRSYLRDTCVLAA